MVVHTIVKALIGTVGKDGTKALIKLGASYASRELNYQEETIKRIKKKLDDN